MKTNRSISNITKYLIAFIVITLFATLIIFCCTVSIANASIVYEDKLIHVFRDDKDYDDNKILVVLDKNISDINKVHDPELFGTFPKNEINDLTKRDHNKKEKTEGKSFRQVFELTLPQHDKNKVKEGIRELEKIDGILSAEPCYKYEPCAIQSSNDPYFKSNDQWGLNGINGIYAQLAWTVSTGSRSIRVGILDSGIANHPDLNANVVSGWDYFNENSVTNDEGHLHGSLIAGVIGAAGNNSTGISGVNWRVSMVPMQIADNSTMHSPNIPAVIKAINDATDKYNTNERIHILNYSVNGFGRDYALLQAIDNYPGLFVWAAGNDGECLDRINGFVLDNLILVGAIDENGNRSQWNEYKSSAYGNAVDIYAPGSNIYTTANNGYEIHGGTSLAAPFVSGAAALLLSYDTTLRAAQVKQIILNKADDISIDKGQVKRLNIGSVLWGMKNPDYLELRNLGHYYNGTGCDATTPGWMIKVTNNSNTEKRVIYNTNMCFENDAKSWSDLCDIEYFYLAPFASTTVNVEEFGTATHVAFSYVVGNSRYITYANELDSQWNIINPKVANANYNNYDGIKIVGKHDGVWIIDATNVFPQTRRLEYNTKMCFEGDARDWTDLNDINSSIILSPQQTATIRISENGFAGTIAVSFVNEAEKWRDIFYAYNLNDDCIMDIYTNSISTEQSGDDSCIAAGTLITLADGTKKKVEDLTGEEELLVWNMYTGSFDSAPIVFIDSDPMGRYDVIKLYFSDGTKVNIISEHAFWDVTLNKYIYLDKSAAEYIGHSFNKCWVDESGDIINSIVELVDVKIEKEITVAYSPVTYGHLCYYVNDMLSIPGGIYGLFNLFDVDAQTMSIDIDKMNDDIDIYGLYTYDEFSELVPISNEVFEAFNGKYLKIAIGKGLIDLDKIIELTSRYTKYF